MLAIGILIILGLIMAFIAVEKSMLTDQGTFVQTLHHLANTHRLVLAKAKQPGILHSKGRIIVLGHCYILLWNRLAPRIIVTVAFSLSKIHRGVVDKRFVEGIRLGSSVTRFSFISCNYIVDC